MTGDTGPEPPQVPAGAPLDRALGDAATRGQWLWDHAGRLAGAALGVIALASMVFLAAIGFKPALYLVVLLAVGVATIAIGGRIRGT